MVMVLLFMTIESGQLYFVERVYVWTVYWDESI
jgi:hypothetical protein